VRRLSAPAVVVLLLLSGVPLTAGLAAVLDDDDTPREPASATSGVPSSASPAPSLFLDPDGRARGACTRRAPCRSFARAYRLAEPGDVVEVGAGRYPEQILSYDEDKRDDEDVTFLAAPGASPRVTFVRFGEWRTDLGARHVTMRGLTIGGFLTQRTEDLTFEDVTIDGAFWIQGAKDVTIRGGSAGGTSGVHSDISEWSHPCCDVVAPERIVIDGVRFHDMVMKRPEDHIECLQLTGGRDITIRRSRFERCDHMDVNAGDGVTKLRGLVVEDNFFGRSTARFGESYYSLSVRTGTDVTIRRNTSPQAWIGPDPDTPADGWLVAGNVMPAAGDWRCHDEIDYWDNRWTDGVRCGPTDR
jgi:hypothetical protein